jgi:hypothetical protein
MAGFRIRETGEYLNSAFALKEYRRGKGGVPAQITEDWLNSIGMDVVFEGPQATPEDQYGYSYFFGLEEVDGKWFTKYSVGPVFQDNEEATAIQQMDAYKAVKDAEHAVLMREQRNKYLSDCDWTQLTDSPVDKEAWATYRQELRAVPEQTGFPWNVTWPTQPE